MNKRRVISTNNKKRTYMVIALITFVFIMGVYLVNFTGSKQKTKVAIVKFEPERINLVKLDQVKKIHPENILERIRKTRELRQDFLVNEHLLEQISLRCENLSQHEQLLDAECSAVWLYRLKYGEITDVYDLLGFENTHWGAIILEVDNKYKAVFKPCSTKAEDTTKEVIASHLDQILGYGQTAPVITRRIKADVIERFSTSSIHQFRFAETFEKCHKGGFFEGPMIGWWNDLTPIRTVRKYHVEVSNMEEMRKNLTYNLFTTQMQSKFHSFYWLINILRHGKDEFITPQGNLVSLDLDRSRYTYTDSPFDPDLNFTWCYTCYFDESVYHLFQAIGPSQSPHYRLSSLLAESLAHEDIFRGIYDRRIGESLDIRVRMYLECIDLCIQKYGRDNVLLNFHSSSMTDREIIDWFVRHSEYKNQNGKKAPSWFKG